MNINSLAIEIEALQATLNEKLRQYLAAQKKQLIDKYFVRDNRCFHILEVNLPHTPGAENYVFVVVTICPVNSRGDDLIAYEYSPYKDEPLSDVPILFDPPTKTYKGRLCFASNGEEDDILSIDEGNNFLAEVIADHIKAYGDKLTVSYWISDQELTKDELTEAFIDQLYGDSEAIYAVGYSEYTGYLGTTEELQVGGHDLLAELKESVGKYLYMDIVFE